MHLEGLKYPRGYIIGLFLFYLFLRARGGLLLAQIIFDFAVFVVDLDKSSHVQLTFISLFAISLQLYFNKNFLVYQIKDSKG